MNNVHLRLLAIALLIAFSFSGCERDSALRGKWVFDRQYTEAHMPKPDVAKTESKDVLNGMKEGLVQMLTPMLLEKLDGATLTITKKEMIMTTKDGNGKAEPYEVLERPDSKTWRTKGADGKIEAWALQDGHLASAASGDVH